MCAVAATLQAVQAVVTYVTKAMLMFAVLTFSACVAISVGMPARRNSWTRRLGRAAPYLIFRRCAGDLRRNERHEVHDALSLLMMLGIPLVMAIQVALLMASLTIA